jgi:hypothetical protein
MSVLASTAGDVLDYALAIFFIAVGAALAYMLVRLGGTFARLSALIKGTERDLLPVFVKSGGTVDRVNDQLDKLDVVTDSAVSMADSADTAVRAVSTAIDTGEEGLRAGVADLPRLRGLRARRDVGEAVSVAKEAAARRESELDESSTRPATPVGRTSARGLSLHRARATSRARADSVLRKN